jgi:hypothetical protein
LYFFEFFLIPIRWFIWFMLINCLTQFSFRFIRESTMLNLAVVNKKYFYWLFNLFLSLQISNFLYFKVSKLN